VPFILLKNLNLPSGLFTKQYIHNSQRRRLKRKLKGQKPEFKKKRLENNQKREELRNSKENSEGVTYKSNCNFTVDGEKEANHSKEKTSVDLCDKYFDYSTCDIVLDLKEATIVYFDLETTGRDGYPDITQIAAKRQDLIFNVYVCPTKDISAGASKLTNLCKVNGDIYHSYKLVDTLPIATALQAFKEFLNNKFNATKIILVAHNAAFDKRILMHHIIQKNMQKDFLMLAGFADSLKVLRKKIDKNIVSNYKLETLAKQFLTLPEDRFHDAVYDVTVLEDLSNNFDCSEELKTSIQFLGSCYEDIEKKNMIKRHLSNVSDLKNVLSETILKKLAIHKITYTDIVQLFQKEGEKGVRKMFMEKNKDNKIKVTNREKVFQDLFKYLNKNVI